MKGPLWDTGVPRHSLMQSLSEGLGTQVKENVVFGPQEIDGEASKQAI